MTAQDQTVSVEAHNRVSKERDDLKSQVAELSKVVKDVGLRDRAEAHFASQGATNARQLAELALPHIRGIEDLDSIPTRLDSVIPEGMRTVAAPATPPTPEDTAAAPDPEPPAPRPAVSGPDPAAPGTPPPQQKIKLNSPEMKERIRTQGWGAIQQAADAGELEADPQNDHAQKILGR